LLGRQLLEKYALTDEDQERARSAMTSSLAIADELQTLAQMTTGPRPIPVS
jgi:hypothetical protein